MIVYSDALTSLAAQRQRFDQVRENSGRFATAYGEFTTTGWGEKSLADCFNFGCTFIERPVPSAAWSLGDDSPDLVETRYPRVGVGVYRWRTDSAGHYTGAWLAFTIDTGSALQEISVADPGYQLVIGVTFIGVALKAIRSHLLESL